MSKSETTLIPSDVASLRMYIYWYHFWVILGISAITVGLALPIFLAWVLGFGSWYTDRFVEYYSAELDDKRLRLRHGVFVRNERAIPLDRVTDILVSENLIERRLGLCQVQVQTAGMGSRAAGMGMQGTAEGVILAIPKDQVQGLRDRILAARDRYSERMCS